MSKRFSVYEDDKRLIISGIDSGDGQSMDIFVDYDDVWHPDVMQKAKLLCKILNEHWPKK